MNYRRLAHCDGKWGYIPGYDGIRTHNATLTEVEAGTPPWNDAGPGTDGDSVFDDNT